MTNSTLIKKPMCSRCKVNRGTVNYCTNKMKNGNVHKYYHCNECNTARIKKWRHIPGKMSIVYKAVKKHIQNNRPAQRAWQRVSIAKKKGIIVVPPCCSECGVVAKLDAHHEDYTKPLDVIFLCRRCHNKK